MRPLYALILGCSVLVAQQAMAFQPQERKFLLRYGAQLVNLKPGAKLRVWLPLPRNTAHQRVTWQGLSFPAPIRFTKEPKYGNRLAYFAATVPAAGRLAFRMDYAVTRKEIRFTALKSARKLSARDSKLFLSANRLVPVVSIPLALPGVIRQQPPLKLARTLYEVVGQHMRYDKSKPGFGNGDVLWACDSRFGNCTDFHSLFIALSRNRKLPARFEIGFPLPAKRGSGRIGGYHCWASFHVKHRGWVPVDISEADKHPELKEYYFGNLSENRVTFSIGRDITLVPKQSGPQLNYFIYPYAEINGEPLAKKHISLDFSYRDQ